MLLLLQAREQLWDYAAALMEESEQPVVSSLHELSSAAEGSGQAAVLEEQLLALKVQKAAAMGYEDYDAAKSIKSEADALTAQLAACQARTKASAERVVPGRRAERVMPGLSPSTRVSVRSGAVSGALPGSYRQSKVEVAVGSGGQAELGFEALRGGHDGEADAPRISRVARP